MNSIVWFFTWLGQHQIRHPHGDWIEVTDVNAPLYYQGWIESFDRWHVTRSEADTISKSMQELGSFNPSKHLGEFKKQLHDLRNARREKKSTAVSEDPDFLTARSASRNCPECADKNGTASGFALRRWSNGKLPIRLPASLYCRCALGQLRASLDRPENGIDLPAGDSLQSFPELWVPGSHHPSWSDIPTAKIHRGRDAGRYFPMDDGGTPPAPASSRLARRLADEIRNPGVPAGLTPIQESFLEAVGPGLRAKFLTLGIEDRGKILDAMGESPTDDRIKEVKRLLAS